MGISGTGKSVFARRLAEKTGLPLFHMDSLLWRSGWVEAATDIVSAEIERIATLPGWILEGWIDTYSRQLLQAADEVIYLDYPGWLAALGGLQRWWTHRGRTRSEMPEGCIESLDRDFIVTMLHRKERPHIKATLGGLPGLHIVRSKSRRDTRALLRLVGRR